MYKDPLGCFDYEIYRKLNREKIYERMKKYREENKDKISEKNAKYHETNKEIINAKRRLKYTEKKLEELNASSGDKKADCDLTDY
jgi:hypothetical protein